MRTTQITCIHNQTGNTTKKQKMESLYQTLFQRKRPEDVAEMILSILKDDLSWKETMILEKAAAGSLKRKVWGYTSMLQEFAKPIGAGKQIKKAVEIFKVNDFNEFDYTNPVLIEAFLKTTSPLIHKSFGQSDFLRDRLNKHERASRGLDISKRNYNKKWRILTRIEKKLHKLARELQKWEFQQVAKHGLARQITLEDFIQDKNTACFIAYYTAKSNLRSEFTISGQQRAFDEISHMLLQRCQGKRSKIAQFLKQKPKENTNTTNWWAIAHVYPSQEALKQLTDAQKGTLLGKWTSILEEIAGFLGELWQQNDINMSSMIVKEGNDSTTWNNTAGAWNKAREHWINLLYATGTAYILDDLCFGKVLRLMAADVVAWHKSAGGGLNPNTFVWNQLPLPWEVFSGKAQCTKEMVIQACKKANVDPIKYGWIAPKQHRVTTFKPTPELVHGVTVSNPFLANVLKRHRYFSGKNTTPIEPTLN